MKERQDRTTSSSASSSCVSPESPAELLALMRDAAIAIANGDCDAEWVAADLGGTLGQLARWLPAVMGPGAGPGDRELAWELLDAALDLGAAAALRFG